MPKTDSSSIIDLRFLLISESANQLYFFSKLPLHAYF